MVTFLSSGWASFLMKSSMHLYLSASSLVMIRQTSALIFCSAIGRWCSMEPHAIGTQSQGMPWMTVRLSFSNLNFFSFSTVNLYTSFEYSWTFWSYCYTFDVSSSSMHFFSSSWYILCCIKSFWSCLLSNSISYYICFLSFILSMSSYLE